MAEIADYVMVMYAGQMVENGTVYDIFHNPLHPYTRGLMNSTIRIDQSDERLQIIPGTVPSLTEMPEGCRFHPRCPYATEECRTKSQEMLDAGGGRMVRCCRWREIGGENT